MIGTLYIDDLDGAVTLFKSTDEGTETIAAFDEEYREVLQDLLTEIKRLSDELDNERNADSGSVSNERIWEQIDRNDRLAAQRVRERLDIEVKETEGEGGYVKYPDPGCGLDSETGRFDMENYEWVNPPERLWLDAVEAEVKRLREENHVLRMVDWEYERVWEWLMENADHTCRKLLLLIEEWKEEDGVKMNE